MARSFTGAGSQKSGGVSMRTINAEIMRFEQQKGSRLPSNERFKMMMKMRLDAMRANGAASKVGFQATTGKAKEAMQAMAAKKAKKERKRLDAMVIIKAANFTNGSVSKGGRITDIAGNVVGQINKKNGVMSSSTGSTFGKYRAQSMATTNSIVGAINQYSPYFINLRKQLALQGQQQIGGAGYYSPYAEDDDTPTTLDVRGRGGHAAMLGGGYTPLSERGNHLASSAYDDAESTVRQNAGGASGNVFGATANNVWGTKTDNVWGTDASDVWGGVGGSPFGKSAKAVGVWGSGVGENFIKPLGNMARRLFGRITGISLKNLN